ncbi:MAG TPA: hypothetical protein DC024_04560 [Clostridiales bacterium]|jgi:hypothetical protein|nr:hypothetical protein [Clostridiales bacterium]
MHKYQEEKRHEYTFFALFLYATMIVDLYKMFNQMFIGLPNSSSELLRNFIYIIVFFYILWDALKNKRITEPLLLTILFIILMSASYFINHEIRPLMSETILMFVSRLMPAYYITRYVNNWDSFLEKIDRLKWLAVLYSLVIIIFPNEISGHYMTLSYNLLIPVIVMLNVAIYKKKFSSYFGACICLYTMFFYGARGPIMCVIFSMIILVIISYRNLKTGNRLLLLFGSIFLVSLFFYTDIAAWVYRIKPNSRTVQLLYKNSLFQTAARDIYWKNSIRELINSPLKIRGFLGDRTYFSSVFNQSIITGIYAHNFIIELFLQFGILIGGLLLVGLILTSFKAFKNALYTKEKEKKAGFATFFGPIFIFSMISGSYLSHYQLWLMFGVVANFIKRENIRNGVTDSLIT